MAVFLVRDTDERRQECDQEAEIGPRGSRGREGSPLEPPEGGQACHTLASRTVKEYISLVLSHPICGDLLWQPEETNTGSKAQRGSGLP